MLPWRAIPVTLAHWREPQIISSPLLCLLLAFFFVCSRSFLLFFFFHFHSFMFFSIPYSLHTQPNLRHGYFILFDFSLTFLSFLIFFITIPSCFLLSLGSVFLFLLLLVPFSGACRTFKRPLKKKTRKERLLDCIYYKTSNVVSFLELFTGRKNLLTRHVDFRRLHCEHWQKKSFKKSAQKLCCRTS